MNMRGRKKINPDYNPVKARDELVNAVSEKYLHPDSDMEKDQEGKATMKAMREYFGLTMTKIRKLLVTAGVYSFEKDGVDMVRKIQKLKEEGLSAAEISRELSVSIGSVNSFLPYESGVYNADFTAEGYDYSNVSAEARRKRNQRKRQKMQDGKLMMQKTEKIEEMADRRTYMDRCKEEEQKKEEAQAEKSVNWLKEHGYDQKMSLLEISEKVKMDISSGKLKETDIPWYSDSDHEEQKRIRDNLVSLLMQTIYEEQRRYLPIETPSQEIDTIGTRFSSERYVHGKPVGDYLFLPKKGDRYILKEDHSTIDDEEIYGVIDEFRIPHLFHACTIDLGSRIICRLEEAAKCTRNGTIRKNQPDTNFQFEVIGLPENHDRLFHEVLEKAVTGLQNLSLDRTRDIGYDPSAQYVDGNYLYYSKQIGSFEIIENHLGQYSFKIDGRTYRDEDFKKLFSPVMGFRIDYQISNLSDPVLENDMTLLPVRIDEDTLGDELKDLLFAVTDKHEGNFIRSEDIPAFDVLFEKIVKKLEVYNRINPLQMGRDAGKRLIRILKNVGTDDDMFPEFEIQMVNEVLANL